MASDSHVLVSHSRLQKQSTFWEWLAIYFHYRVPALDVSRGPWVAPNPSQ